MLAITRITVREGLRKKQLYLFVGIAAFMILVLLSPGNIRWDDGKITEPRLIAQIGLWMTLVFTSFLAVFVSMNAIGSEVERGSTHLALVRPVSRARFWMERTEVRAGGVEARAARMAALSAAGSMPDGPGHGHQHPPGLGIGRIRRDRRCFVWILPRAIGNRR